MNDRSHLRQLTMLPHPFRANVIHSNPSGGGTYVKHSTVQQRLIDVFGSPPRTTLVDVIRGDVAEKPPNPKGNSQRARNGSPALSGAVVGVVCRMEAEVEAPQWWLRRPATARSHTTGPTTVPA